MAGNKKYNNYEPSDARPEFSDVDGNTKAPAPDSGRANYALLKSLFGGDAKSKELYSYEQVVARADKYLAPNKQVDGGYFFGEVYLDFQNPDPALHAPNIENEVDPAALGVGGPSSPWTPNLSSPDPTGGGSTAPVDPVILDPALINSNAQPGVDGLVDPAESALSMYNGNKLSPNGSTIPLGSRPKG